PAIEAGDGRAIRAVEPGTLLLDGSRLALQLRRQRPQLLALALKRLGPRLELSRRGREVVFQAGHPAGLFRAALLLVLPVQAFTRSDPPLAINRGGERAGSRPGSAARATPPR